MVRLARALVAACGVAMAVLAGGLLLQWRHDDSAAQRYLESPCTAHPVVGVCANVTSATVISAWTARDAVRGLHALVRVAPAGGRAPQVVEGVWPNDAFVALRPGMHVDLIWRDGRVATVRLDPDARHPAGLRLWTVDNPLPDRDLNRDRGLAAGGVGLLALVLVAPPRISRLPARRLREALGDRSLRVVLLAFVAIQMLDVATSIAGRHRLLYEGIALTRSVVGRWGDAGFLLVKVPAVLAVVVLAARLPRRWAMVPVVAAAAPVALVVGGNLRLLVG